MMETPEKHFEKIYGEVDSDCHFTKDDMIEFAKDFASLSPKEEEENNFDDFLKKYDFQKNENDNLRWDAIGSYGWIYSLYFEGYAYVLYKQYRDKEVPLAHFQDANKLDKFYEILNNKMPKDEFSPPIDKKL